MATRSRSLLPLSRLARQPLAELLPRPGAPIHLDLGTGLGHFLADMAGRYPEQNWIGVELERPIARRAARRIDRSGHDNALLLSVDGRLFLQEAVPSDALDHIWINFPDPWPKDRHAARRHSHPPMLALLLDRLALDGELHLATDVPAYLDEFRERIEATGSVAPAPESAWARSGLDVETKYERKWQRGGKPLHYADWRKVDGGGSAAAEVVPYQRIDPPALSFTTPPAPGTHSDGRRLAKVFRPRRDDPDRVRVLFIDRETGTSSSAWIDVPSGTVEMQGVWTPWKRDLLEALRDEAEKGSADGDR